MSLFQCEVCGCVENTGLSSQGFTGVYEGFFDWVGIEDRRGKRLCSACGPTRSASGNQTEFGKWHGIFARTYLPKGQFRTAPGGLEHVLTGERDYRRFALSEEEQAEPL